MSFANHNILDIALSIIPPTVVQIRKSLGVAVNAYAQATAAYTEWREVYGIVQPGGESNEHTEGIDYSKKHVKIWLRGVDLTGTHIQEAPDQIRYLGRIYNVISVDDWFPYDNYRMCECVEALNLADSQKAKQIAAAKAAAAAQKRKTASSSMAGKNNLKKAARKNTPPVLPLNLPTSGETASEPSESEETAPATPPDIPSTVPSASVPVKKPMIRF